MISLSMTVLDENAGHPCGNPFPVRAVWERQFDGKIREVGTGIAIKLGKGMKFDITPIIPGMCILGHNIADNGELVVYVLTDGFVRKDGEPTEFASVGIQGCELEAVRFMETKNGSRVVMGQPEACVTGV